MATRKTTKKKNGPRTRRYGCITYRSEPQDNPDCRGRCSPPARMVSEDGRTKVTQIRYRRRNLDVVRKNCACDLKPSSKTKRTAKKAASKTTAKTATKKTVKAPAKKAPAKKTAVKTVKKAPAKTAVKKTASKIVSCGCAVTPAKTPSKPKTVTCGCAQTPAKKAPIKAPASWKVPTVGGKFEGKAEPIKAPASWKVPTVGGKFEGKAVNTNIGATLDKNTLFKMRTRAMSANLEDWEREVLSRPYINVYYNPSRDKYLINGSRTKDSADDLTPAEAVQKLKTIGSVKPVIMNPHDPFRGRHANKSDIIAVLMARPDYAPAMNGAVKKNAKAPFKAPASWKVPAVGGRFEGSAPAKKTAAKKAPAKKETAVMAPSPRIYGTFKGSDLKRVANIASIIEGSDRIQMPLFDDPAIFVDKTRMMMLCVYQYVNRSQSLAGCSQLKGHRAVDMGRVVTQIGNGEVRLGLGEPLDRDVAEFQTVNGPRVRVPMFDTYADNSKLYENLENYLMSTDQYRTTVQRLIQDLKKVVTASRGDLPSADKDPIISVCPNGELIRGRDAPSSCGHFSNHLLYRAIRILEKAGKKDCTIMMRPGFPMRIRFDIGTYVGVLFIAPTV